MVQIIVYILIFILGIGIGAMYEVFKIKCHDTSGKLVIASDPSDGSDYIFLEISKLSMPDLKKQEVIELQVVDRTPK